jgi:HAD superfamily hydrolase (TIGR01509 family)
MAARAWAADEPRFERFFANVFDGLADARHWRLEEGALETLASLRARGIATAIVSNWDARLPTLLAAIGLTEAVDAVVVSFEVGVEKPAPGIFGEALRRVGVGDPADAWHVGDHPREDVAGAREAGMQPILFAGAVATMRLGGAGGSDNDTTVPVISRLGDLVDLVNDSVVSGSSPGGANRP